MTLPELHLADWRPTKDTLHLYSQIVGKIRLATTAPRNHWWNVPLYVDVRGLTTRRLHHHDTTFEITIDFVDHARDRPDGRRPHQVVRARRRTARGGLRCPPPCAARRARHRRRDQGGAVRRPDDDAISRRTSTTRPGIATPSRASAGSWTGRTRCSRSSAAGSTARRAPCTCSGTASTSRSPGSRAGRRAPIDADPVTQEAYSQEVISFGFWAGDDNVGDAAYYSYTAPEPEGLRDQPLSAGEWIEFGSGSLAILPYETVRTARDPRQGLLAFCQSAYEAGARLAGWDTAGFESTWCPSPAQLDDSAPTPLPPSGEARSVALVLEEPWRGAHSPEMACRVSGPRAASRRSTRTPRSR